MEKVYMRYLLIAVIFCFSSCAIPLRIVYTNPKCPISTKKIIRIKDSKQVMIRAIMIESGLSEPEATILWERYKKSDKIKLSDYLINTNYWFKLTGHGLRDDIYVKLVELIKVRTKMLKRGRYEKTRQDK